MSNGTTLTKGVVTAFDASKYRGLKKSRNSNEKSPIYSCNNCKCNRYSQCGCKRKGDK